MKSDPRAHLYVALQRVRPGRAGPRVSDSQTHVKSDQNKPMAIYHYSVQVISRGAGRSVVAAAAYRAATSIKCERTGLTHDYTAKEGVAFSEVFAPTNAPVWVTDRATLWNEVEAAERRHDAQTAREVNLALPKELDQAAQIALLRAFVQEQYVARGMVADVSFHADDPNNPHAHILLTLREIGPNGFGLKQRDWNSKEVLKEQREAWAIHANRALERAGLGARIDHRSLAEQGVQREPTFHLGPAVYEMEARGIATQKGEAWRNVVSLNEFRARKEARQALIDRTVEYLTQQHSTFSERDVMRYVTKRASAYLGAEELRRVTADALADPRIVKIGKNERGELRFSTAEMRAIEANMVNRAEGMAKAALHKVSDRDVKAVLTRHVLSDEQVAALKHITAPNDIALIQGVAGAGKTRMLAAAREAWEAAGYHVRGAALAGKAADGLQQGAGINSQTIHALLGALETKKTELFRNTVLVVDEAGMVGSRQLSRLLEYAEQANAKVVLVGDSRQLQPIDAGGAFRALGQRLGYAELREIHRQREAWQRQAVHELAGGGADLVLRQYYARGLLAMSETKQDAIERVFSDWEAVRAQAPDSSQIILAGTRAEVQALNNSIRRRLKEQGELEQNVRVSTERGAREFAVGDRVIMLRNNSELGVRNGNLGRVTHVEISANGPRLGVLLDDGKAVSIDPKTYDSFDHGYAMTVHKAQGVTVDHAYVVAGRMHDRELSYVSMSRARERTMLYVSREERDIEATLAQTAERMSKSNQKDTTLDHMQIVEHGTRQAAMDTILKEWTTHRTRQPGATQLVLVPTREEMDTYNRAIRDELRQRGALGMPVTMDTERGEREFAKGDRVQFVKDLDDFEVRGGSLATVTRTERKPDGGARLTVRLDDGRELNVDQSHYRALDHGYATSGRRPPRDPVDHVYAVAGPNQERELGRAARTRGRDTTRLYVHDEPPQTRVRLPDIELDRARTR
jgi:Ti-type conjugative transfer relaxase TraA